MIRWTTVALLLGSLLAGALYDRVERSVTIAEPELQSPILTPLLAPKDALSTDWYCPVGSTIEGGYASHTVYVTNTGDEASFVTVETLTELGAGSGLRLELAPRTTEAIDLASLAQGYSVGAVIEMTGGEGVVGHRVETASGVAEAPCSTATSDTWFFGGGITTRDARYYLALMNPSLNAIVFQATFRTETRVRVPQDLDAKVVNPRSTLLIDVTDFVAREQVVSAEIRTVQGGLVVERLQTFDGALGPIGASLQLGAPSPSTEWNFLSGLVSDFGNNKLAISNVSEEVAEIDLFLNPTDPADRLSYGLLPRELTIGPGRTVLVDLDQIAEEIGLLLPYELGVQIVSANGVSVVAERWHLSPSLDETLIGAGGDNAKVKEEPRRSEASLRQDGGSSEAPIDEAPIGASETILLQPIPDRGVAMNRGVEGPATRWVVPWVTLAPDGGTALVLSAGESQASVQARLLVAGEWQPPVRAVVAADGRVVLPLVSAAGAAPILITSDAPIVVEAQVIIPGQRHDVMSAVPLRPASD